jgi:hypothetical protein
MKETVMGRACARLFDEPIGQHATAVVDADGRKKARLRVNLVHWE